MPKTQYADYDTRREAITARATALYAERGFAAASVADLAAACRTSKSLIYHYFPSKEDILFEVIDGYMQALEEAAFRATLAVAAPEDKLRGFAREIMALNAGCAAQHRIAVHDVRHLPAARRERIGEAQRRIMALFDDLLVVLRPAWREQAGRALRVKMFFGLIDGACAWYDSGGPVPPSVVADLAVEMFLGALPGRGEKGAF